MIAQIVIPSAEHVMPTGTQLMKQMKKLKHIWKFLELKWASAQQDVYTYMSLNAFPR